MRPVQHDVRIRTAERTGSAWLRHGPSRALLALGGAFLVLCSALVVSTGGPGRGVHHASIAAVPEAASIAELVLEPGNTWEPRTRTPVQDVVSPVATSPAVTTVRAPSTSVSGSLCDAAGAPIGGDARARVCFVDRSGRLRPYDVAQDGEYTVESLALGTHWATVSAEGFETQVTTIELSADRPRLRMDFTLRQAVELRVHVTARDGGRPLDVRMARQLVPVATREPLGERYDDAHDDARRTGRFEWRASRAEALPPECMGVLVMDDEQPAWVSLVHDEVVLQTRSVHARQAEVTFVVGPEELSSRSSEVRVRVLDAHTGLPLHRARVRLSAEGEPGHDILTDDQGLVTLHGHAAGRSELLVRSRTYAELRLPVDVLQGGVTEVGAVTLEPEVTVAGLVLDREGRPRAAKFSLGIVDPMDRSLRWSSRASVQSSEDGSFVLRGLGRHEYVLRSSDDDRGPGAEWKGSATVSGNVVLDTRAGSLTGLEVRVRPASKLVLHTSDGATGNVSFRVLDAHGLEAGAGSLQGSEPRALELPPGTYRVSSTGVGGTGTTVELGSDDVTLDLARR